MPISIVDVVQYKYPGQFEKGRVGFYEDNGRILIQFWNVPNIEKPTEDYLESLFPEYEERYQFTLVFDQCVRAIDLLLDSTAQYKLYKNAISCATYLTSENEQWSNEAKAFIAWRDVVFTYAFYVKQQVENGEMPLPTVESFLQGMPQIVWP